MSSRILIADDTPVNLKVLSAILTAAGHTPLHATNGQATLDLARREGPDLILLDIMMPGKDGYAVCAELKADPALADIPVIFLSALQQTADKVRGLELGAADYVAKPFDRAEVLARINTQLRLRQLTRSLLQANAALQERQSRLEEDLRAAADIQRALLPKEGLSLPGVSLAWHFAPCEAVGGDLFGALVLDDRSLGFYILDVSGHGVPSAMLTVSAAQSLTPGGGIVCRREPDSLLARAVPPAEVLSALDREYPFERFERYFTISYLVLELEGGTLRYSSAAHPPPLLLHPDGTLREMTEGGPILGAGLGPALFEEGQRQLHGGERVFLYTDGIPEFEDPGGRLFGRDSFCRVLRETASLSLAAACEQVAAALREFGGTRAPQDDVSLLAFELVGAG
jgi:sigma-B regulation protein RsbU (phosphoserine phosphatase)